MLTEGKHPGEAVLRELDGGLSRGKFKIGASQTVLACALLALIGASEAGAVTVTPDAGNTGAGAITMATPSTGVDVVPGNYTVICTGGTKSVSVGAIVGTGAGALTLASPAFAAEAKLGEWHVVCVEEATDGGAFNVEDPDGVVVGRAVVGTPFTGDIKFTIADGTGDFSAGSFFPVTVVAAVPSNGLGSFTVTAPDGTALAGGIIGTPYTGTHVKFTWADGSPNMIVGDKIVLTVAASGEKLYGVWNPTGTGGYETAVAMAFYPVTTGVSETAYISGIEKIADINVNCVAWPAGVTDGQKATAIEQLALKDIRLR